MTVVRIPQQDSASELSTDSHEPLQHKVETLKRYWGGGEQTMPHGVATARGGFCAPHRHVLCKDEARRIAANIAKLPLVAPTAGVIEV